jgi:hypothetical protein
MKNTLAAGLDSTREFVVDRSRTIDFMGEDARVYATPMLVRDVVDVEQTRQRLRRKQAQAA